MIPPSASCCFALPRAADDNDDDDDDDESQISLCCYLLLTYLRLQPAPPASCVIVFLGGVREGHSSNLSLGVLIVAGIIERSSASWTCTYIIKYLWYMIYLFIGDTSFRFFSETVFFRDVHRKKSVRRKWREIRKSPKAPTMGFWMGSHRGTSLCRLIVVVDEQ